MDEKITTQIAYLLNKEKAGRRQLALKTGYSESQIRTQLEKMRERSLVVMSKMGTELTVTGENKYSEILKRVARVSSLPFKELKVDDTNTCSLLKGIGEIKTWSIRDLAVQEGATGVVIISCVNRELRFSDSNSKISEKNPHDYRILNSEFEKLENNDLIVIVFGPQIRTTNSGLWKIIHHLLMGKEV